MITGIKKSHKTTEIFFDEGSDILVINTYNTSLKNRLTAYARVYPDLCRQTDDNETGGLSFEIQKDRFSFRLLPPCSDERKEKARACAEALNQSRKSNLTTERSSELSCSSGPPSRTGGIICPEMIT